MALNTKNRETLGKSWLQVWLDLMGRGSPEFLDLREVLSTKTLKILNPAA